MFILGNRLVGLSLRQLLAERLLLSSGGTFILLTVFLWSVRHLEVTIPARLAIVAAGLVGYALLTWSRGLDRTERGAITDLRRAVVAAARYGVRS